MTGIRAPLLNHPTSNASTVLLLLLTDDSVMCHDEGAGFVGTSNWWKLTPDSNGDYVNGSTTVADLVAVEMFHTDDGTWKTVPTPPGWSHIGDASCCVLPDGKLLIGSIDDNRCAIIDQIM